MKKTLACLFLTGLFFTACSSKTAPTTSADTALDKKFFDEATSAGNLKQCDQILDKNLQKECLDFIDASEFTAQAKQNLDLATCNKIALKRAKDDCVNQVNTAVDAKNFESNRISTEQEAVKNGNPSTCDKISDENQKATCKYNVLSGQASLKKNPAICNGIGSKSLIEKCKEQAK